MEIKPEISNSPVAFDISSTTDKPELMIRSPEIIKR
jgi:hypothetical protein